MTTKVLKLLVIAVSIAISAWAQSQSSCAGLLQQGIYDTFSSSSTSSGYSQLVSQFCGSSSQYSSNQVGSSYSDSESEEESSGDEKSLAIGGSVSAVIEDIPVSIGADFSHADENGQSTASSASASGSLSTSQISSLTQLLCSGTLSNEDASNALQQASEFIDPNIVQAYEECLAQNAAGLQVSTTIREDQGQVTIQMIYIPPPGTPYQTTVNDIEISPPGSWDCAGSLWDLVQDSQILTTSYAAMSCTRNVSWTAFNSLGQSVYAPSSSIIIITSSGTVVRNFIPLYANPTQAQINPLVQRLQELNATLSSIVNSYNSQVATIENSSIPISNSFQGLVSKISTLSGNLASQGAQLANMINYTETDISATCYQFALTDDNSTFGATCNRNDNTVLWSCWDLSDCIGVWESEFICQPGANSLSEVTGLSVSETILSGTLDGSSISADLSSFFSNRNGRLECECQGV